MHSADSVHSAVDLCLDSVTSLKSASVTHVMQTLLLPKTSMSSLSDFIFFLVG